MTNNELSRKMLSTLLDKGRNLRFQELVEAVGADARAVFKNLFFLEEKGYVQLSTSYPSDNAVYPIIQIVRMRQTGEQISRDPSKLDLIFPLSDTTTDTKLNIPPEINTAKALTFGAALEKLALAVRRDLEGETRDAALLLIESLLSLPIVRQKIP